MEKVFWENPYKCKLTTNVASVSDSRILFDETIAFSFSGGQESDKTYVNGMNVLNSEIEGNLIYYTLPDGHEVSVGDRAICVYERRLSNRSQIKTNDQ